LPPRCLFGPGIIAAEAPQMPLQITTGITAATITGVFYLADDLGSRSHRSSIMSIRVLYDHVRVLRFDATDLIRLLDAGIIVDRPSLIGVVIGNFFLVTVDGWDTLRARQPSVLKKCFPRRARQMLAQ
jgi:hypothetical protein